MVEFRSEVVRQLGLGYMVRTCLTLLGPFVVMAFGLFGRTSRTESTGKTVTPSNSGVGGGSRSMS